MSGDVTTAPHPAADRGFFLWVGGPLPPLARLSVASALASGFRVTLFVDRPQDLPAHPRLEIARYEDVYADHPPEAVTLTGRREPYYAGFANAFRYRLLAGRSGWWFDCDTLVTAPAAAFAPLATDGTLVLGREDAAQVNNAVMGAFGRTGLDRVDRLVGAMLPHLRVWGDTGPKLVSRLLRQGALDAALLPPERFYPVHFTAADAFWRPEAREGVEAAAAGALCVTLWREALRASGLLLLRPPEGSYLGEAVRRHGLGPLFRTDEAALAAFLAERRDALARFGSRRALLGAFARITLGALNPARS